ncbi:ABL160Cp [Eremothecium gossypii ATCC 10895]|uniref:ABL160Cp n=1 Tax=Eremothecium gossypii (strain ATCC 10895 / CBS 109.51 / FGSC 9923 / NRRL Y-1056) TaxID=284811 RepID=Q75E30_EREGS|nr:ABL160Cp [Eremothecium gossypii ATCC 10895]AAS50611.2 ABL160Cp [Eremothecium gossypii ATCC 10895]
MSAFSDRQFSTKSTAYGSPVTGSSQMKLDVFLIKGYQLVSHSGTQDVPTSVSVVLRTAMDETISEKEQQRFQKLSQLYNAIIQNALLLDSSSSPKSAIELYQRFQQILKELELSGDASPYAKYFCKLEDDAGATWHIRDDQEMQGDSVWHSVSENIKKIYDSDRGLILPILNKRRSAVNSTRNSPPPYKEDPLSYQQLRRKLSKLQGHYDYGGPGDSTRTVTAHAPDERDSKNVNGNGAIDFFNGGHSRSRNNDNDALLRGYYTMPTSPTSLWSSGINLSLQSRREFSSQADNDPVEELLQMATGTASNNAAAVAAADRGAAVANANGSETPLQKNSTATADSTAVASGLTLMDDVQAIPTSLTLKETELYDRLLKEKDERIIELERQLVCERNECQWLRKLLLEDVGCIRNMLTGMKDR